MKQISLLIPLLLCGGLAQADDCVVLLHGLMRSSTSMNTMQRELEAEGFLTANIDYPSRDHTVEELAGPTIEEGLATCRAYESTERIHFVGHSLGGILVRQYLSENDIPELGRVVMLGPPNQGSAAVDEMEDVPGFDWLTRVLLRPRSRWVLLERTIKRTTSPSSAGMCLWRRAIMDREV